MIKFDSMENLIRTARAQRCSLGQLTLREQALELGLGEDALLARMDGEYAVMEQSVRFGLQPSLRSNSGLTGGDAYRMQQSLLAGQTFCGDFLAKALVRALAVSETNAAMGRIVAAPTAGSCGILPAALLTMQEERRLPRETAVLGLFTASAVGMVIARNASLAGAEGGCQAECGSAAAMAAAALVEMAGGSPDQAGHAVAIALKNVLGLVCDPVAGLVEIPCIKRNAGGVAGAITAAQLALAGIESAIPADEVILTMKRVGDAMPCALRETAQGGLAVTPTGKRLLEQVFGKKAL